MRTSMGPSCAGLTCNFALVRLLATIKDTRSATPCGKSGESTAWETFKVGVGAASVPVVVLLVLNCAAPAAPPPPVSGLEESPVPLCEDLPAEPILASAAAVCALAKAAGLETGTDTGMAATAGTAVSRVALPGAGGGESSVDASESGPSVASAVLEAAAAPGSMAAAAAALAVCAVALVYAEAPVFVPLVAPLAAAFGVDVAASTAATAATAAAPEI